MLKWSAREWRKKERERMERFILKTCSSHPPIVVVVGVDDNTQNNNIVGKIAKKKGSLNMEEHLSVYTFERYATPRIMSSLIRWMTSSRSSQEQCRGSRRKNIYIHYCYHHSQEGKAIKRCAFVPWLEGEESAQLLRCWSGACQVNNKYNMQIKIIKRESGKKLENEKKYYSNNSQWIFFFSFLLLRVAFIPFVFFTTIEILLPLKFHFF